MCPVVDNGAIVLVVENSLGPGRSSTTSTVVLAWAVRRRSSLHLLLNKLIVEHDILRLNWRVEVLHESVRPLAFWRFIDKDAVLDRNREELSTSRSSIFVVPSGIRNYRAGCQARSWGSQGHKICRPSQRKVVDNVPARVIRLVSDRAWMFGLGWSRPWMVHDGRCFVARRRTDHAVVRSRGFWLRG